MTADRPLQRQFSRFCAGLALFALVLPAAPASAQGLLDFLFGNIRRAPPPVHSYADPYDGQRELGDAPPRDYGPASTYCVRTCDGRFFPVTAKGGADAAELCRAFCPASPTRLYSGGGIANAVGSDGKRYADMPNAFAYRDKVVAGCTCNGKDPLGLASIDTKSDPTLRPGDIVAVDGGLSVYRGSRRGTAQFTPVDKSAVLGGKKVSAIRVEPRPQTDGRR